MFSVYEVMHLVYLWLFLKNSWNHVRTVLPSACFSYNIYISYIHFYFHYCFPKHVFLVLFPYIHSPAMLLPPICA